MGKEILALVILKLKKKKIYYHKRPILLRDGDIEKVLISNKISAGEENL